MVIMHLYGHVFLIRICKLALICINSESRHVILTAIWANANSGPTPPAPSERTSLKKKKKKQFCDSWSPIFSGSPICILDHNFLTKSKGGPRGGRATRKNLKINVNTL